MKKVGLLLAFILSFAISAPCGNVLVFERDLCLSLVGLSAVPRIDLELQTEMDRRDTDEKTKVVILLFGSGKIVIAGAKKLEEAGRAVDNLAEELRSAGLLP